MTSPIAYMKADMEGTIHTEGILHRIASNKGIPALEKPGHSPDLNHECKIPIKLFTPDYLTYYVWLN